MTRSEAIARSAEADDVVPVDLTLTEKALWLAHHGDWHAAHDLCQDLPDPDGAWIHAWLHREEGDYGNACYWYAQAGKSAPAADADLVTEWKQIAAALLD